MRVLIVGSHPSGGHSMRRFSRLLERGYRESHNDSALLMPTSSLSRQVKSQRARKWLSYFEKFVLFLPSLFVNGARAEIIHIADQGDLPYYLLLRFMRKSSIIVTCHDIFALKAARGLIPHHPTGTFGKLYQMVVYWALRNVEQVVSVSGSTQDDLLKSVGVHSDVVLNPVDPWFQVLLRNQESGSKKFLLCVAEPNWRKRREASLTAWKKLRATSHFEEFELVIVGSELTAKEESILTAAERRFCSVVSNLSDGDLARLYAGASAVISLGNLEGFGWPVIEGNTAGTPALIASDSTVLDLASPGSVMVDMVKFERLSLRDWEGIAGELIKLQGSRRVLKNAERFSWELFVTQCGDLSNSVGQ